MSSMLLLTLFLSCCPGSNVHPMHTAFLLSPFQNNRRPEERTRLVLCGVSPPPPPPSAALLCLAASCALGQRPSVRGRGRPRGLACQLD
jgi:hypothetical protein